MVGYANAQQCLSVAAQISELNIPVSMRLIRSDAGGLFEQPVHR